MLCGFGPSEAIVNLASSQYAVTQPNQAGHEKYSRCAKRRTLYRIRTDLTANPRTVEASNPEKSTWQSRIANPQHAMKAFASTIVRKYWLADRRDGKSLLRSAQRSRDVAAVDGGHIGRGALRQCLVQERLRYIIGGDLLPQKIAAHVIFLR